MHGRGPEPRRVEDLLSRTQVAGAGRLPHLMEGESARAVEEGQPSQTRAASKAKWLMVVSTASPATMCPQLRPDSLEANSVPAWTLSGRLHAPSCSTS